MADAPSPILLLRLQGVGGNVNTWGGYLNTALSTLEQAAKGYQALAVTGSATIAWTQYQSGNTGQCATLLLTGSLASPAVLTFPSYQNFMLAINTAGAAVTIMCSGGVGVTIPNGEAALIYCDGIDYHDGTPSFFSGALTVAGQIHGVSAGIASTDAVNLGQVQSAIAAASIPATPGTFLNSINDKNAGFGSGKVTASGLLQATTVNPGANESLNIATLGYAAIGTNAYVITPSPVPSAAQAFQTSYLIEFQNVNTGVCTLADGSGTYPLVNDDGAALTPADIPAGGLRFVIFDGTSFRAKAADAQAHLPIAAAFAAAAAAGLTLSP